MEFRVNGSPLQYIDTAAPELQLIECALLHDTTIFLKISLEVGVT